MELLVAPLVLLATSVIAIAVGIRLLSIARRTAGVPEAAISAGFLGVYLLGIPLAGVGRIPALVGSAAGDVLFGLGVTAVALAMLGYYVFTWRTFRPRARWASALVAAAAIALAATTIQVVVVVTTTDQLGTPPIHAAARWMLAPMGLVFLWMAAESLAEYGRARRRVRLGLSDPVVANRLLLWGAASLSSLLTIVLVFSVLTGERAVFQIPLFQWTMSVSNAVTGCCWWLAFLPPRVFVERLRAGAPESG